MEYDNTILQLGGDAFWDIAILQVFAAGRGILLVATARTRLREGSLLLGTNFSAVSQNAS